ncbi:MAG: twin transmembrane helix small protein [Gammaproteobacteria bacterium]|nr:twin transmembrane helix small protein [Gammaproteobacteria bacterium]
MADQPFIKFFVILMLIAIVVSLVSAFFSLIRDKSGGTGTVKALTIRVGLSVVLFIILMVLAALGIIKPH